MKRILANLVIPFVLNGCSDSIQPTESGNQADNAAIAGADKELNDANTNLERLLKINRLCQ